MREVSVIFTDMHIPFQDPEATEVVKKVLTVIKPDYSASLGDLLDCSQFSTHDPTYGLEDGLFDTDIRIAQEFLDIVQKSTKKRLILVEGNHEWRCERWAAKYKEGRAVYNMIAPHIQLMKRSDGTQRKNATYIKYGATGGGYPHYKLNSRVALVHGWSVAQSVTSITLGKSQGVSVIVGHCHRVESKTVQSVWGAGSVHCHSIGCLCKRIPLYGCGSPVDWSNAFCLGFHGSHSDTFYPIPIVKGSCVLPDGREIKI